MSWTKFKAGSIAKASEVNENFDYLTAKGILIDIGSPYFTSRSGNHIFFNTIQRQGVYEGMLSVMDSGTSIYYIDSEIKGYSGTDLRFASEKKHFNSAITYQFVGGISLSGTDVVGGLVLQGSGTSATGPWVVGYYSGLSSVLLGSTVLNGHDALDWIYYDNIGSKLWTYSRNDSSLDLWIYQWSGLSNICLGSYISGGGTSPGDAYHYRAFCIKDGSICFSFNDYSSIVWC